MHFNKTLCLVPCNLSVIRSTNNRYISSSFLLWYCLQETSELCAALDSASIDTSEPFNPCVAGKMKEGVTTATSLTATDG